MKIKIHRLAAALLLATTHPQLCTVVAQGGVIANFCIMKQTARSAAPWKTMSKSVLCVWRSKVESKRQLDPSIRLNKPDDPDH